MQIELVDNWKQLWKSWVMWLGGFGLLSPLALKALSDWTVVAGFLPEELGKYLPYVTFALILIARPIKQPNMVPETGTTDDPGEIHMLYGSSLQPHIVKIGGKFEALGVAVNIAFKASSLTEDQWNNLPEDDRERRIAAVIDPAPIEGAA